LNTLDTQLTKPYLLAVYRVDGKNKEKTIIYNQLDNTVFIAWVLPPLTMSQIEIMGTFFKVVRDIIFNRAEVGGDPHFQNNFNYGQAAGFDLIQAMDYSRVMMPNTTTNLPMEAIVIKLSLRERDGVGEITNQYEDLTGIDTQMDLINNPNDEPDEILEGFVELNSNYNPSNFPP